MPQTCQYEIQGNPDGPTLFFIHGWPDDASYGRLNGGYNLCFKPKFKLGPN